MELTHAEFIQLGKKAVFYFVAPHRIDFRTLVRDLVSQLKVRIELRQISVRERASSLGALGPCGLQLCCSSFLSRFGNVNIKMAKNQNLALNPTRLNGVCGLLKCCLSYEDQVYKDKRKTLPSEGTFCEITTGEKGKVLKVYLIKDQFDFLSETGIIRRYIVDYYDESKKLPNNWSFLF